jgi:hypothetical protein
MGGLCFGSGGGADEYSLTWLRHAPVWKVGIEVLDEPWRGDAPPRAMLVVMAEGDVVHDEVLPAADVQAPSDAAGAVKRAVDSIASEATCYPRTLLVHDDAVAAHLAPRMKRHATTTRVAPSLRQVHNAIRHLASLLDEPDAAWDLVPVYDFREKVDPAFAAVLFPAAARFWRARPWERVADEAVRRFRWRSRKSVVVLTPPRGHGHVVTLFTSARDYYEPRGWLARRTVLGIRFVPAPSLARRLHRQIEMAGWEVAAPDAYPLLMGDGPALDGGPSFADIQHLVAVLDALAK